MISRAVFACWGRNPSPVHVRRRRRGAHFSPIMSTRSWLPISSWSQPPGIACCSCWWSALTSGDASRTWPPPSISLRHGRFNNCATFPLGPGASLSDPRSRSGLRGMDRVGEDQGHRRSPHGTTPVLGSSNHSNYNGCKRWPCRRKFRPSTCGSESATC